MPRSLRNRTTIVWHRRWNVFASLNYTHLVNAAGCLGPLRLLRISQTIAHRRYHCILDIAVVDDNCFVRFSRFAADGRVLRDLNFLWRGSGPLEFNHALDRPAVADPTAFICQQVLRAGSVPVRTNVLPSSGPSVPCPGSEDIKQRLAGLRLLPRANAANFF